MNNNANIFNQKYVKNNHIRAVKLLENHQSSLLEEVSSRLVERIYDFKRTYNNTLEVGSRGNILAKRLANSKVINNYYTTALDTVAIPQNSKGIVCNPENIPIKLPNFDLIISLLSLHSLNNLKKTLKNIKSILNKDGVFIAVIPGGKTLATLKDTWLKVELEIKKGIYPRISPMSDLRDIGNLLKQAGFINPLTDTDVINKKHLSVMSLMHEIRFCGESNSLADKQLNFTGRHILKKVINDYENISKNKEGDIVTTFVFVFLTGIG